MKTISSLTMLLTFLVVVLGLCLFADFAANHDILNDYVSKSVINQFLPGMSDSLPEWSNTTGEWLFIHVSYLVKVSVSITMFFVLLNMKRKLNKLS